MTTQTEEIEKQSKIHRGGRGGARPGAGRKAGRLSDHKIELRDLARPHAAKMLKALVELAETAESESARVAAIKEVLDRAYGKAPQGIVAVIETPKDPIDDILEQVGIRPNGKPIPN